MPPKKRKTAKKNHKKQVSYTSLMVSWFLIVVMGWLLAFLPPQNAYSFRVWTENYEAVPEIVPPTPQPLPVNTTGVTPPHGTAQGVMVVDVPTATTLYEKNPDLKLLPASTTKIMTALVATELYQLDDVVTVKTIITEGQVMGLITGEKITVENLLYGILVHSANDAAQALAEHHRHGYDAFITRMNSKARELHLANTHYVNPIGFDDLGQYTTARDLARLSLIALGHPEITKIAGVPQITVSDIDYQYFHSLKSINELLGKIPGVSGLKTGWTEEAGQALVATVQRDGRKVLIVVLHSDDRFGETETLLNWVFSNHEWQDFSQEAPLQVE